MTPSPPATADRLAVAAALREIGLLLEVKGGNPYRARAYKRGASAVEALAADLTKLVAEDRLTQVPGIGAALAAQIAELHRTGRSSMLERLRAELPPGILDLVRVPNLSVERVAALHRALGIRSVAELKAAAEAGRVREVKGFGEKTEKKILDGIAELEARGQTLLLHEALQIQQHLTAQDHHLHRQDQRLQEIIDALLKAYPATTPEVSPTPE